MADEAGDHLTAVSAMEIGSIGILTEDVVDPSGPGASAPLRSAYRATTGNTDPNGVSTFRTRETRLG
jgi:hypothetical protein